MPVVTPLQIQINEQRERGQRAMLRMNVLIEKARRDKRELSADERATFDAAERESGEAVEEIDRLQNSPEARTIVRDVRLLPGGAHLGKPASIDSVALRHDQRLGDRLPAEEAGRELSLRKWLRGMATGDWAGAQEERDMTIGTPSAGGYLVPTPLSATIIDLARNEAAVMKAGARTVEMTAETLKLARQTGDAAAAWRAEASSITSTDLSFEVLTLTAHTLAGITKISLELLQDAPNAEEVIRNSFAKSIALELDRVALYGSGSGSEPTGLIAASVSTTSMGTNGAALTNYDPFVDAIYAVESNNFEPNAAIFSPRTQRAISKLKDTQNNPLRVPQDVADLAFYVTKQARIDRTQGSSNVASDVFVGDWSQLIFGMRVALSIRMLDQRYIDTGEIGFLAWLRADVAPLHLGAFNAVVGVL